MQLFQLFVVGTVAKLADEIHSEFGEMFGSEAVRNEYDMLAAMTAFYAKHKSQVSIDMSTRVATIGDDCCTEVVFREVSGIPGLGGAYTIVPGDSHNGKVYYRQNEGSNFLSYNNINVRWQVTHEKLAGRNVDELAYIVQQNEPFLNCVDNLSSDFWGYWNHTVNGGMFFGISDMDIKCSSSMTTMTTTTTTTAMVTSSPETETDYLSYGCWGQLLSNISPVGKPLDALDAHFRNYRKCKQCVAFDWPSCNLTQVSYEVVLDGSDLNWRLSCDLAGEKSNCQVDQCKCDEELAFKLQALFDQFDEQLKYKNGFDHAAACPKVAGQDRCYNRLKTLPNKKQCCGKYPHRAPFTTQHGCKSCCGDQVFFNDERECCEKDELRPLGTCN